MGKEPTTAPREAGVQTAIKTTSLLHTPRLAVCQGHLFQPQPWGQTPPGGPRQGLSLVLSSDAPLTVLQISADVRG